MLRRKLLGAAAFLDGSEAMELVLFALMIGIPAAVSILTKSGEKRGCGRGCASCGNRSICHKGERRNRK